MKEKPSRIYKTNNLDLSSYLVLNEIPYLGCEVEYDQKKNKPVVFLRFLDEKLQCKDLEIIFARSKEKSLFSCRKLLLKQINKSLYEWSRDGEE